MTGTSTSGRQNPLDQRHTLNCKERLILPHAAALPHPPPAPPRVCQASAYTLMTCPPGPDGAVFIYLWLPQGGTTTQTATTIIRPLPKELHGIAPPYLEIFHGYPSNPSANFCEPDHIIRRKTIVNLFAASGLDDNAGVNHTSNIPPQIRAVCNFCRLTDIKHTPRCL